MRVAHYMSRLRLEDGGVVRAVLDLCAALAATGGGHEITLLTLDGKDVPQEWGREPNTPRVQTLARSAFPLPRLNRRSIDQARAAIQSAEVLHLHVPWDPICSQLARLARRIGRPYVMSIHGMLDDWCLDQKAAKKKLFLKLGGTRMLERAAAVHCTATAEAEQSRRWFPRGNPAVVPLIMDLSDYEYLPGPDLARQQVADAACDEPIALFLSRLHHKKGLDVLIDAAARLRDDGVRVRVLIAGTGNEAYIRSLQGRIRQQNLDKSVRLIGFVKGREKVSLYEAASVFVLPTSQENWGFVLIESMAAGTPVITTRGVDIWPELESSGAAIITEAAVDSIAKAVASLVENPSRSRDMGQAGRSWVLNSLRVPQVVRRYEALYLDICRKLPKAERTLGRSKAGRELE